MNELKVFSSTEFGELGVMLIDGKEYFPATQCAKILGYSRPADAISAHCKGVCVLPTPSAGGVQKTKFIPESDLYRLIVSSKLPKAEEFERWVFDCVLPQIRHNGGYVGNVEDLITKTATAVVSEVMKQIMPLIMAQGSQPVAKIDISEYKYKPQKSVIETLDGALRSRVDEMIKSGEYSHQGVADFLRDNGVTISQVSVSRYARSHFGIEKRKRTVSFQISLDEIKED